MPTINITSLNHPGIEIFSNLTESQLRSGNFTEKKLFIAESPKVINVALNAGYKPTALLCERKHIEGDAKDIISRFPNMPVYTGEREILSSLTGYTLTRGCFALLNVGSCLLQKKFAEVPSALPLSTALWTRQTLVQFSVPPRHSE